MILKVQLNQRIDSDLNWSLTTEIIADNHEEAATAGEEFMHLMENFRKGMLNADLSDADTETD